jgi:hypothetical protein
VFEKWIKLCETREKQFQLLRGQFSDHITAPKYDQGSTSLFIAAFPRSPQSWVGWLLPGSIAPATWYSPMYDLSYAPCEVLLSCL